MMYSLQIQATFVQMVKVSTKNSSRGRTRHLPECDIFRSIPNQHANRYTIWSCSDTNQASSHGPDSVRITHQEWSQISTKYVQTTSGRGLKFSRNMFGPSSGLV